MNPVAPFPVRPMSGAAPLGRTDNLRVEAHDHRLPGRRITLAIIEDSSWSGTAIAMQFLRWHYEILCIKPADLFLCGRLIEGAALIVTTRSRWQIERIVGGDNHPPVITTDDFDLGLRARIEAYLRHLDIVPPV